MSETVLVTGATGLAGANICKQLTERGDHVRALARETADTAPLAALGVEVVTGDVTDADAVLQAARGADSAIHCAALLGGASQNLADFEAVNINGTKNVLDAAEAVDLRRVVAVSTGTFFDTAGGLDREDAPVTQGAELGSLHHHEDGRLPRRHGPRREGAGRGEHPPGRHLRPLAGGQQRAGHRRASTGCCCRRPGVALSAT